MSDPQPGDFAVIRTKGPAGVVIRIVTRSSFNHAVFFISPTHVVEARLTGAVITPWSYYEGCKTALSSGIIELTDAQREQAPVVGQKFVGIPYGWLDILSVGLLQYGIKPKFVRRRVANQRNLICSQLVDTAEEDLGLHLFHDGRTPQDVTPGDLAHLTGWR